MATGTHLEASLLTASLLKKLRVSIIWAKAISEAHGRILEQLGNEHVVHPEHEMGRRGAHLLKGRILDFTQFGPDDAMAKTEPPAMPLGKPLSWTGVRRKRGVTVVGLRQPDGPFRHATGDTVLEDRDTIIVSGLPNAVERFSEIR